VRSHRATQFTRCGETWTCPKWTSTKRLWLAPLLPVSWGRRPSACRYLTAPSQLHGVFHLRTQRVSYPLCINFQETPPTVCSPTLFEHSQWHPLLNRIRAVALSRTSISFRRVSTMADMPVHRPGDPAHQLPPCARRYRGLRRPGLPSTQTHLAPRDQPSFGR